jgi:hypothetical protein
VKHLINASKAISFAGELANETGLYAQARFLTRTFGMTAFGRDVDFPEKLREPAHGMLHSPANEQTPCGCATYNIRRVPLMESNLQWGLLNLVRKFAKNAWQKRGAHAYTQDDFRMTQFTFLRWVGWSFHGIGDGRMNRDSLPKLDSTIFVGREACRWPSVLCAIITCCCVTLSSAAADSTTTPASKIIPLVTDGKTQAVIVVPADISADTQRAVDDLARYVQQSSGATLAVEKTSAPDRLEIHIGQTDYARGLNLPLNPLGTDGFMIAFPSPNRIVLAGGSASGTEFAVYDFLERYVGVRWLFPGDLGTYVPKTRNIDIPMKEVVSRPAYISRTISTMQGAEPEEEVYKWLQRQRRHWTIQHHHNLNKLFAPDEYFKDHPNFYPLIEGKREKPNADGYGWQPILDADGIVEAAVKKITAYFDQYPNATSYSLGINDTNNFDRPAKFINSVGVGDYSDYFYRFADQVAEGVEKKYPDKWFGCLAYLGVTDPPRDVKVNPRIVPHICIDRYGWADPAAAKLDEERTEKWQKAAPVLGWYDYIYGGDMYRIPRIYTHLMGRYLKFGAEHGVKAYYAELYASPQWTEGPKMYVVMKLLWDPSADVDQLLKEWYTLAVGKEAAVPLAKYYQFWEEYWMKRVPQTDWFKQYVNRTYFDFDHNGYLDALSENDLAQCRQLMDQVVDLAQTPEQKKRAAFLEKGFEEVMTQTEYMVRLRGKTSIEGGKQTVVLDDSFKPAAGQSGDQIPPPWGGWQNEPGTARFYWDHQHGYKDEHSLAINASGAGTSAVIYQRINVDNPQPLYHLSAMVQCNQVNPDAYVGIVLEWSRRDDKYLPRKWKANQFYSARLYPDGKWKRLDVYSRPPQGVGPLSLQISLSNIYSHQGIIRLDDLKLVSVDGDVAATK